ncbi:MAG TPA: adenylate kinase [Actinomycetes bacterium]|nr:adenylate kinase [Actinomycetes bacterium]
MRLLIVGPPGAGKGTQAAVIAGKLGVPHIATGEIFRANVADATPLGRQARSYMDEGELVPDTVTNAMVIDRLELADARQGFLLDGYPRNADQADVLAAFLADHGQQLDVVVQLVVDDEHVLERLLERARQQGRTDDTHEVIRHRLDIYHASTEPLIDYYRERDVLRTVDGIGSIEDVTARILALLPS